MNSSVVALSRGRCDDWAPALSRVLESLQGRAARETIAAVWRARITLAVWLVSVIELSFAAGWTTSALTASTTTAIDSGLLAAAGGGALPVLGPTLGIARVDHTRASS